MDHFKALEFDVILKELAQRAVSDAVKDRCLSLSPCPDLREAELRLDETSQAKSVMRLAGAPPLSAMTELKKILTLMGAESILIPEQLEHISSFIATCRRMVSYLKKAESTDIEIAYYGRSFIDLSDLEDEINRCVRNGQVDDRASKLLYDLRRGIENKNEQIRNKLEQILRKNKEFFSEGFITVRGGRYTLPVKREYKNRVEGVPVELSNTGGTYFIEPAAVRKLQDKLAVLLIEEDSEIRRILYTLTELVHDCLPSIRLNIEAMEALDFLFAKAKLSADMKASRPQMTDMREMRIISARHPLLKDDSVVPLDFALGGDWRGLAVTGPNTGGKTVALKTVGLLSLMAQSGLHVPADEVSAFCMFNAVLCDIGDGQSITENLSTFSSHMTNIIEILRVADEGSLVLLDELGSGTDPAEGMGIAMALLDELLDKRCLFAVTTHYPEIKDFAARTAGIVNARMAFDRESLMPLFRLEIGEAGESCALHIAERLGMPVRLLDKAREITYTGLLRQRHIPPLGGVAVDVKTGAVYAYTRSGDIAVQTSAVNADTQIGADVGLFNSHTDKDAKTQILADTDVAVDSDTDIGSDAANAVAHGDAAADAHVDAAIDSRADAAADSRVVADSGSGAIIPVTPLIIEKEPEKPEVIPRSLRFAVGDSVTVYPQKEIGIVYARANDMGEIGVQIKGRKRLVNHKRLKLKVAASELYPDDYDFSIVFDSVANRKARHLMSRKHVKGNIVVERGDNL